MNCYVTSSLAQYEKAQVEAEVNFDKSYNEAFEKTAEANQEYVTEAFALAVKLIKACQTREIPTLVRSGVWGVFEERLIQAIEDSYFEVMDEMGGAVKLYDEMGYEYGQSACLDAYKSYKRIFSLNFSNHVDEFLKNEIREALHG